MRQKRWPALPAPCWKHTPHGARFRLSDIDTGCARSERKVEVVPNQDCSHPRLTRVLRELQRYEHPLLTFDAHARGDGVEVVIGLKAPTPGIHAYCFGVHPRDLDSPQFAWQFQRQLYDCLHYFLIGMFIRTPQDGLARQRPHD